MIHKYMMTMKKINIVFAACLLILLASCKKDSSIEIPISTVFDTIWTNNVQPGSALLSLNNDISLQKQNQTYPYYGSINTSLAPGLSLETTNGQLLGPNNTPVTGNINIKWTVAESKGEVIRNLAAYNSGDIDNIVGLLYIQFEQNGQILSTSSNFKMQIDYYPPTSYFQSNYLLFHSQDNFSNQAVWQQIVPSGLNSISYDNNHFDINTNNTGWLLIGHSESSSSRILTLRPSLPSPLYTNKNTAAFLLTQGAVYSMRADFLNRKFYLDQLNSGLRNATLLIISKMEDSYYLGKRSFSIAPGTREMEIDSITTTKVSLNQMLHELNSL
jgi:hypothetical protein